MFLKKTYAQLKRETDKLQDRVQDLTNEVETLKRIIAYRDDRIAQLETLLAQSEGEPTTADAFNEDAGKYYVNTVHSPHYNAVTDEHGYTYYEVTNGVTTEGKTYLDPLDAQEHADQLNNEDVWTVSLPPFAEDTQPIPDNVAKEWHGGDA